MCVSVSVCVCVCVCAFPHRWLCTRLHPILSSVCVCVCVCVETLDRKFSAASDVWALAVTFWEMLMGCKQQPYGHIRNLAEVIPNVKQGMRLTKPSSCPEELWDLMCTCWEISRADRPSVQMLVQVCVRVCGRVRVCMCVRACLGLCLCVSLCVSV